MAANLPDSDLIDLREYLFIDAPRVRMLVSQLRGGAPESTRTKNGRSSRLRVGLKVLEGERGWDQSGEDTIALSDLYVSMLEDDAEALGIMKDLSQHVTRAKFWKRGSVRNSLQPGMLLRITAPTRLVDASAIVRTWRGFEEAAGEQGEEFSEIVGMIEALYGENLAVSVLPCGADNTTCAFIGVIGHGGEHIALDRTSLLSRMGPDAQTLTTIMQLARIPSERDRGLTSSDVMADLSRRLSSVGDGDRIDRGVFDRMLLEATRMIEDFGLQNAPKWPAMAMTPLAIYRQVLPTPEAPIDDDDTG